MGVPGGSKWITHPEARRRLAVGLATFRRLIADGALTCRQVPGGWPSVLASDVDELAEASTRPRRKGAKACAS